MIPESGDASTLRGVRSEPGDVFQELTLDLSATSIISVLTSPERMEMMTSTRVLEIGTSSSFSKTPLLI